MMKAKRLTKKVI